MSDDLQIVWELGSPRPATEPCDCDGSMRRWHWHDSPGPSRPVTCLQCGRHWWMLDGQPVDGPPVQPWTDYLRKLDASGINIDEVATVDRDGTTPLVYDPVGPLPLDDRPEVASSIGKNVGRFTYWLRAEINPW